MFLTMTDKVDIRYPIILEPHFAIGNVVAHTRYNFRGVVVDVDGMFQGSLSVLESLPESTRPQLDQPWYHILVHGGEDLTYMPESMLHSDGSDEPVLHPMLDTFLKTHAKEGRYSTAKLMH